MTLIGLTSAYRDSLRETGRAILPSQLAPTTVDHRSLCMYARERGVSVSDLAPEELATFVHHTPKKRQTIA